MNLHVPIDIAVAGITESTRGLIPLKKAYIPSCLYICRKASIIPLY